MEDRISREMSDVGIASTTWPRAGRKNLLSADGTITYSMTLRDFLVLVTTESTFAMTITLPSVSEARGKIYVIKLVTSGGTENCTVQDRDDTRTDLALSSTTAGDDLVLYSDGEEWHILLQNGFAA